MLAIESFLHEQRCIHPSPAWQASANLTPAQAEQLYHDAQTDAEGFWKTLAETHLTWEVPFTQIHRRYMGMDMPKDISANHHDATASTLRHTWFEDGTLSLKWHCIDRHAQATPDKVAFYWEGDDGTQRHITYKAFATLTETLAHGLHLLGLTQGDTVVIYMALGIEAIAMMHACASLGIIHSVVFAGFSAQSLADRILDTGASLIVTANVQCRLGKALPLKPIVDEALALLATQQPNASSETPLSPKVLVYPRTTTPYPEVPHRDLAWEPWLHQATEARNAYIEANKTLFHAFPSEQPLFILYTSGSTGKPKGLWHSTAGYLLWSIVTMLWVMDAKPATDVFWCTADIGWITGHTYVAYGPMALGMTQLLVEGTPTYPHAGRWFECIERYQVTQFYTAPTAIRTLMKLDATLPQKYPMRSLRLLGSVGEPINPEAWMWFYEQVGKTRCPIVDTWWQTETGGHLMAPLPGVSALKPGSCHQPLPGIEVGIMPEATPEEIPSLAQKEGSHLSTENHASGGALMILRPFPSMARGIWGDPKRFARTYFPNQYHQQYYLAGDACRMDEEGYFWMMGRLDDVINVSGHRLGTMEIESALASHPQVAEAAVVPVPHAVKGEAIMAFVVLKEHEAVPHDEGQPPAEALTPEALKHWVSEAIAPIAKPDMCYMVAALPKTRSGKVMRRLLKVVAQGANSLHQLPQDLSTLENPSMLTSIFEQVYSGKRL